MKAEQFETVSSAVLGRKRLKIRYHSRSQNEETEREISPQRLVHYRDNWYLDAWCHLRKGLRMFSLDGVRHAERDWTKAKDVSDAELDQVLGRVMGYFSGEKTEMACYASARSGHAGWHQSSGIPCEREDMEKMVSIRWRFPTVTSASLSWK